MLVLSRRVKEKICFPEAGITIHFIRTGSDSVKIGIDAPVQMQIVRNDVEGDAAATAKATPSTLQRLPRHVRHEIRNQLQMISVGLHLFKEQMQMQFEDRASETFDTVMASIRAIDENEFMEPPGSPEPREQHMAAASPRPLLIVDHHTNERELLASVLRHQSYDVTTKTDVEAAMNYLDHNDAPAAILVNIEMPDGDGPALIRYIRHDPHLAQTTIYAISETSPAENGLASGMVGVDGWFLKPLNIERVIDTLTTDVAASVTTSIVNAVSPTPTQPAA